MAARTGTADADFRLNSGIPSMKFRSSRVPKRAGYGRNDTNVVRVVAYTMSEPIMPLTPIIEVRLRPR